MGQVYQKNCSDTPVTLAKHSGLVHHAPRNHGTAIIDWSITLHMENSSKLRSGCLNR